MSITLGGSFETNGSTGGTDAASYTVDIGTRTDGLLECSFTYRNTSTLTVSSVTWNGVEMSFDSTSFESAGLHYATIHAYLVAPANGSNTLTIRFTTSAMLTVNLLASWWDGAHQNQAEVLLAAMTKSGGTTDPSLGPATPPENNALVVASYISESNDLLAIGAWGTDLVSRDSGNYVQGYGYVIQTTAAGVTATWTGADSAWSGIMAFYKAKAAAGGGNPWLHYRQQRAA